jgi:hypothetical protein
VSERETLPTYANDQGSLPFSIFSGSLRTLMSCGQSKMPDPGLDASAIYNGLGHRPD